MHAFLMITVLAVAVPDRQDTNVKDAKPLQELLQGEWQMTQAVTGGNNNLKDQMKVNGTTLVIKGNEMKVREADRDNTEELTFTLDAAKKPAAIDLMPKRGGPRRVEGIIKIEGDTLSLCFPHAGEGERPSEFVSPPNSKVSLLQFKRVGK
jgi:uncharacterized protein (TIGR03067 family)